MASRGEIAAPWQHIYRQRRQRYRAARHGMVTSVWPAAREKTRNVASYRHGGIVYHGMSRRGINGGQQHENDWHKSARAKA